MRSRCIWWTRALRLARERFTGIHVFSLKNFNSKGVVQSVVSGRFSAHRSFKVRSKIESGEQGVETKVREVCAYGTGLPPTIVECGISGSRSFPTPVGTGSPGDFVTSLLDVLVLNGRAGLQFDSRFMPKSRQNTG